MQITPGKTYYLQPGNLPVKMLSEAEYNGTVIVEVPESHKRMARPGETEDDGLREVPVDQLAETRHHPSRN